MKIFFCKGGFEGRVSGGDRILVSYATRLRSAGHHPSLIFNYSSKDENQYSTDLRRAGIPTSCVTEHPLNLALRAVRKGTLKLPRTLLGKTGRRWERWQQAVYWTSFYLFKRRRPDVAHVLEPWGETATIIRAAHAAGVPVLYQDFGTPRTIPGSELAYDQLAEVLPLCSEVAALSPHLVQMCRERLPYDGPSSVLPLIAEDDAEAGSWQRSRPADGITFGFAARLEQLKGPLVLLDAFAAVLKSFPDARLRVAGTGPQEAEVIAHAESLGVAHRCEFIGAYAGPEERRAFLRSLDVFILPSYTEGTPNSIIEAMSHALPSVASSVGGIPDMLAPDAGILVPPGDAKALGEAMARLATDAGLRAAMGSAARRRYEDLFSAEAVLPVLLEAYRRVSASRGGTVVGTEVLAHPWATAE
jgi:glycosyltransferase involved in cell wall biosynthesis